MMSIAMEQVSKRFGSYQALEGIDLRIPTGELVALLGPSGSGKTTLLRIIAGLEEADAGNIRFQEEDVSAMEVRERQVGFVFQHYALFRHMNIFDNIAFGLNVRPRSQRPSKKEIKSKVDELLQLVKLDGMAQRYPAQLSGGQRQRVALARALAVEPQVLLLDEPFGALDAKVRKELRRWLRRLHDELHITSILVTHDQEEALDVADRVVILNEGRIEQEGTPDEVYEHPKNAFVCNFLGDVNFFQGRVRNGRVQMGGMEIAAPEYAKVDEGLVDGFVRPYHMEIWREVDEAKGCLSGEIVFVRRSGATVLLEVECEESHEFVEVEISREQYADMRYTVGEQVFIRPKKVKVFLSEEE